MAWQEGLAAGPHPASQAVHPCLLRQVLSHTIPADIVPHMRAVMAKYRELHKQKPKKFPPIV